MLCKPRYAQYADRASLTLQSLDGAIFNSVIFDFVIADGATSDGAIVDFA